MSAVVAHCKVGQALVLAPCLRRVLVKGLSDGLNPILEIPYARNPLVREKNLAERKRKAEKLILFVALVALALQTRASALEQAPAERITQFFGFLVDRRVKEAAELAIFSDEQGRAQFIQQWSEEAPALAGFKIQSWEIEARKGSAEVVLQYHKADLNRTLNVGLTILGGVWRIVPQESFKLNPPNPTQPRLEDKLEELVDVASTRTENRIELSVTNRASFSVLFRFDVDLHPSLRVNVPLPLVGILPPAKEPIPLCNLEIVRNASFRYSWRYSVRRADDNGEAGKPGLLAPLPQVPAADESRFFVGGKYAYGLPYPAGEAYLIWQGPGGAYSHSEPASRYAVDFSMPLGSEVAAAREGVVIGLVQKNPDNPSAEPAPPSLANEVAILHADGTISVYAHLTTNGAKVRFGQTVRRGQVIGLSGNSGYSRGPHLHFAVLGYGGGTSPGVEVARASERNVGGQGSTSEADWENKCLSVPFEFLLEDGTTILPREGIILIAGEGGTATISERETRPWRIIHRYYDEYDTEIRYFAKTIDFLASNKTRDLLGIELSFSELDNVVSIEALPRRSTLLADGAFHPILTLRVATPGEKCSFSYFFRRVEAPGMEHVPLRVERDAAEGYVVEVRYFSDRIEFYAENKRTHPLSGSLDFRSLANLSPKEKMPKAILLPAGNVLQYLATLRIVEPAKGYSFQYVIGPSEPEN